MALKKYLTSGFPVHYLKQYSEIVVLVNISCPLLYVLQPQSDLYGLIQVMIVVFGEEPPVFSRPTTQAPYQAFQAAGPPNRE